ncbi:MAG: diphosphate--fructose-6-phosphate 1-phosphotransferase [Alphaproteobacteria bacterium]
MTQSLILAQGGGPTAVINQTLVGAVLAARQRDPSLRILGARFGVSGLVNDNLVDLTDISEAQLRGVAALPSAALGSTRDKPDADYCARILQSLADNNARAFVYLGGNDTSGSLDLLRTNATDATCFVHAPKTIDNDLMENDHTPGFISAAWFVAAAFASVDLDFRAMPGIYAGIVMGRHAGFLTAASAAWRASADQGPHLVYGPEIPFSPDKLIADIEQAYAKHGRCIIALSEGVQDEDGRPMAESLSQTGPLARDAHGNVQLSGSDLGHALKQIIAQGLPGIRARVDTFGYLPRGNIAMIAERDAAEAFAVGEFAAEMAFEQSGSVALTDDDGTTRYARVPLESVANRTRHMPGNFYNSDGNDISDAGLAYLHRLVPRPTRTATPFI